MKNRKLVIERIEKAWGQETYSHGVHFDLTGDFCDLERQEVSKSFLNKTWNQVPKEVVLASYPNPFLIGSEAFRYFMPIFLITALEEPDSWLLGKLTEFQLNPPKKARALKEFCDRFNTLSNEQAAAVVEFLNYCKDYLISYDRAIKRIENSSKPFWQKKADGKS